MNEYLVKILDIFANQKNIRRIVINLHKDDSLDAKKMTESYIENNGAFSDRWKSTISGKDPFKDIGSLYFSTDEKGHFLTMRRSSMEHKARASSNESVFTIGTFFNIKKQPKRKLEL